MSILIKIANDKRAVRASMDTTDYYKVIKGGPWEIRTWVDGEPTPLVEGTGRIAKSVINAALQFAGTDYDVWIEGRYDYFPSVRDSITHDDYEMGEYWTTVLREGLAADHDQPD